MNLMRPMKPLRFLTLALVTIAATLGALVLFPLGPMVVDVDYDLNTTIRPVAMQDAIFRVRPCESMGGFIGTAFAVQVTEIGTAFITAAHVTGGVDPLTGDLIRAEPGTRFELQNCTNTVEYVPIGVTLKTSLIHDVSLIFVPGYRATKVLPIATVLPKFGDKVVSVGAVPIGVTIEEGTIGKLDAETSWPIMVHTADPHFGSSGGPVLNSAGEVVGVNSIMWPSCMHSGMAPLMGINEVMRALRS